MESIQDIPVTSAQSYASVGTQSQQSLKPFSNLDLTEAQRASMRSIFAQAKKTGESQADVQKQINGVLTTAQQQTLAADIKARRGSGADGQSSQPFADLHLSAAQSTALGSILANAKKTGESQAEVKKQIDAVLTTAQQQTLANTDTTGAPPNTSSAPPASTSSTATAPTSTDGATLTALASIQNQAAAAQSARINTLMQKVLETNGATTAM